MNVRDRVKELRRVPASELRPNPKNWRTHPTEQADALKGLLAEVGFAGAALAYELPDGSLQLIDGHLRAEAVPGQPIPVLVLDVTEAEADKLLATFDPIGAMAGADAAKLDDLLRGVQTGNEAVAALIDETATRAGVVPPVEPEGDYPDLNRSDTHTITLRYAAGDEPAIKAFVGCAPGDLLDPVHTGQAILERIKAIAAG